MNLGLIKGALHLVTDLSLCTMIGRAMASVCGVHTMRKIPKMACIFTGTMIGMAVHKPVRKATNELVDSIVAIKDDVKHLIEDKEGEA